MERWQWSLGESQGGLGRCRERWGAVVMIGHLLVIYPRLWLLVEYKPVFECNGVMSNERGLGFV